MAINLDASDADQMLWRTRLRQADRQNDTELFWYIWAEHHIPEPRLPVLEYETERVDFLRAVGIETFTR